MDNRYKLLSIMTVIVVGVLLVKITEPLTVERSQLKEQPVFCTYAEGRGKVVRDYECLSSGEYITSEGEVFDANVCAVWEGYNVKEK